MGYLLKPEEYKLSKPLNFVLIGRSGSGKGTQAKLLIGHFGNLIQVASGDLFRNLAEAETAVGKRVKKILANGGLPPDDLAVALWTHEIAYKIGEKQGIIADGFPRRLNEAKILDQLLNFLNRGKTTFYILIDISRNEAFNRLLKRRICKKCGKLIPWLGHYKKLKTCDQCGGELVDRPDDTNSAIKNRLDYYDNQVTKVIRYYKKKGKLIIINGEQPIEDVFKDILKAIKFC